MSVVDSQNIAQIVHRTLSHVDVRLVNHGERVAYMVLRMLDIRGETDPIRVRDLCFLAMLHDIGAYKTEEIDHMVSFETGNVWDHSVYGYLFIKYLSPLNELAPAILYHHLDYQKFATVHTPYQEYAQMINIADRADVCMLSSAGAVPSSLLQPFCGTKFSPELLQCFRQAEQNTGMLADLQSGAYRETIRELLRSGSYSEDTISRYIYMMIYSIDFRSFHTVTHTITTACISSEVAQWMDLNAADQTAVAYGALLHDLGKISIPVEILEFPGKLSPQAMRIMRTHVDITEEILGDCVREDIKRIAVRHHEKLDGSGYPLGLAGKELSLPQRIVAVSDVVSALSGTRSYKDAFDPSTTLEIVGQMAARGLIDREVTSVVEQHFAQIMEQVHIKNDPVVAMYHHFNGEYRTLRETCMAL